MFGKLINILKENPKKIVLQKAVTHVFWKRHPPFGKYFPFTDFGWKQR